MPGSLIWQCLTENGITLDQLQKVWKKKSLYFIGKAQLRRQNYKEAIESLEEALVLVSNDSEHAASANELRELIKDAKAKYTKEKAKEKSTWSKAFKKGKEESSSMYHDPTDKIASESPTSDSALNSSNTSSVPKKSGKSSTGLDPNSIKVDLSTLSKLSEKKTKKSSTQAMISWQPDFLAQYGIYLGLGAMFLGGVAAFWWFRPSRR
jgi:hypothetical protein